MDDSEALVNRLLSSFRKICKRKKPRINLGKSNEKRWRYSKGRGPLRLKLNATELEKGKEVKYLRSTVSAGGGVELKVNYG